MNPKKRIGDLLLDAGIIDETQLKAALGHQRQWGVRLGQALVDLKLATERDIVRALSLKFGFEVAKLDSLEPYGHEQALKLFPREFVVRNNVFPMWADTANVTVAMSDPTNLAVVDEIRFRTGRRVKVCIGGDREIAEAVRRHYPGEGAVEAIALDLEADGDATIAAEAVFDPFGGGSKDALDAFFGSGAEAPPPAAGSTATVRQPPGAASAGPRAPVAPPRAAASPAGASRTAAAPPVERAALSAASPRPAAPAPAPPVGNGRASPTGRPAPAAVSPAAPGVTPPASRPLGIAPPPAAAPLPAPGGPPRAAPRPRVELELEELPGTAAARAAHPQPDAHMQELTPLVEGSGEEPILASDLAPDEEIVDAPLLSRDLSEQEMAILESLDRLADGAPAEPDIVKPAQAMAAMIRLLIHKHIVTEQEFLDELSKK